jgi:hypothetical protein
MKLLLRRSVPLQQFYAANFGHPYVIQRFPESKNAELLRGSFYLPATSLRASPEATNPDYYRGAPPGRCLPVHIKLSIPMLKKNYTSGDKQ